MAGNSKVNRDGLGRGLNPSLREGSPPPLHSSELPEIAQALLSPSAYPHAVRKIDLIQTQMSFVFMAGRYVYKVKKPVNLGYLDYTTLEKRKYFCEMELKLNQRLCQEAYLAVVPVTQGRTRIKIGGKGAPIEYAVKMLALPQNRMMNVLLDRDGFDANLIPPLARKVVEFHHAAATNPEISRLGEIEAIRINVRENEIQTEPYIDTIVPGRQYERLREFNSNFLRHNEGLFRDRVARGRIRDCHGDLYTQHVCFTDTICIFDCIEFNDRFRYCDVASEVAFLAMDLDHYGRADLSWAFTSSYCTESGDSQLVGLLKFYKCYRAYVRAKVECFKSADPYFTSEQRTASAAAARSYFDLAWAYSRPKPMLFITVGLVGSGKSTLARAMARRLGLTIISSDVVRKQLADVPLTERHFNEMNAGLYSPASSRRTYDKLLESAQEILRQRDSVILDASYIRAEERRRVQELANATGSDFFVIECQLGEEETRRRLERRVQGPSISDGRWELYGPQKNQFQSANEVSPQRHFVIDSGQPLEGQIGRVIEGIAQNG